jgi:hypothetical protein
MLRIRVEIISFIKTHKDQIVCLFRIHDKSYCNSLLLEINLFLLSKHKKVLIGKIHGWKYQTKCTIPQSTGVASSSSLPFISKSKQNAYYQTSNTDMIDSDNLDETKNMQLKCSNVNDFLFIGLTQYGVSSIMSHHGHNQIECQIGPDDCMVTVDYLANECNGLNQCTIQLDSQFLHTCKNHSDYLSVAYECIPGAKRIDICSNEELYIIDPLSSSSMGTSNIDDIISRFGSFYLSSPNYPNEYANNLNNCSCKINYVHIDGDDSSETVSKDYSKPTSNREISLVFKTFEFDMEESDLIEQQCNKDYLRVESYTDLGTNRCVLFKFDLKALYCTLIN